MIAQPSKTEAIKAFLLAKTHKDLAERYHSGMELQLNVAADGGERVDGDYKGRQWHGFTDGLTTWKPVRIPWNAGTDPSFTDSPMTFDLAKHAEGIGMTGWDWQARESVYVGYDFDAIVGHSDKHAGKLTDQQLKAVQSAACEIPWVTVRRSTSGNGLHLYVYLDGVPTENHNEHAALARAILGKMAGVTGFDFHSSVDVCGSNLWIWHRKMLGTQGLTLIKQGDVLYDVPPNWKDHVAVVKGTRRKTVPALIAESPIPDIEQTFDDLTSQRSNTPLDDEHRRLIEWLNSNEARAWWDQDRHMLVTHTYHLKQAHSELNMRGIFETVSQGTERGQDQNTYLFPARKGAWSVRRFTPGVSEHPSWTQDGQGWTTCYLNRSPDLGTASKTVGGIEDPAGGFVFTHASEAVDAAAQVGVIVTLPPWANSRQSKLKEHKDGRLVFEIHHDPQQDSMAGGLPGWLAKGKHWTRVFHANLRPDAEVESGNYDDVLRHLVTESGDAGWTIKTDGKWIMEPLVHVKVALQGALGLGSKEVTGIVGASVFRNWRLVNQPFQIEYPGDRQWNRGAAQFRFAPTENREGLQYPTWLRVLNHCGKGLDDAIRANGWCRSNGILTGGDYLKVWVASLFQRPLLPLPYLFLYSQEQNTGKSIFHEALWELVTNGVARADSALTNQQGFNGELANAVLCVVEETDLSRSKVAYNRIKDYVTSRTLQVHPKGETPYSIPNSTHWVQAANDHKYCPVLPGDTRITMIYVPPLAPEDLIPKERLLEMLRKEASDFMAEILGLEIPASGDRLNVPVIETGEKLNAQSANQTRLECFLSEYCFNVTGRMIKLGDFADKFHEWLDAGDVHEWTKQKIGKELPPHYPKGRRPKDAQFCVGNISWEARRPDEPVLPKLVLTDKGLLVPVEE